MQADLFDALRPNGQQIAGVDEAGRGPLAGPVYAAAVVLNPDYPINGLNDSKKLSASRRELLAAEIRSHALQWSVACATVREIDTLNILQATFLAMRRALQGLENPVQLALIDGNRIPPGLSCAAHPVVGGDALHACISAASILAKTARDAWCDQLHQRYPAYGFDQHKGYGTALHMARLQELGPCEEHRRSFSPVQKALLQQGSRS